MIGVPDVVIYHANCNDGWAAAWAVHHFFQRRRQDPPRFIAAQHGQPARLEDVVDKRVLIVDFSYPTNEVMQVERVSRSLLILDHHETARERLEGLPFCRFDMKRSGAGMAWDHFFPCETRPWFIDYVEDHDLWNNRLEKSGEVNAYLGTVGHNFCDWDQLLYTGLERAAELGAPVLRSVEQYVAKVKKNARRYWFGSYRVPVVNAPHVNISELVGELAKGERFAVGWFQRGDGLFQYSLRSRGRFDVGALAAANGGGGHRQASGFTSDEMVHSATKVPWKNR